MKCPKCGKNNFNWAKKCEHCGHGLLQSAPTEQPRPSAPTAAAGPLSTPPPSAVESNRGHNYERRQDVGPIASTSWRPFGNAGRLGQSAKLILFRDLETGRRWYTAFLANAQRTRPPRVIEVLLGELSGEFWMDAKVVCAFPFAPDETAYDGWMNACCGTTNGTVRPHDSSDDEYRLLHRWLLAIDDCAMLTPASGESLDPTSQALLNDNPDNCLPAVSRRGPPAVDQPVAPHDVAPEIPFRLCVHRQQGISFHHPSEWVKVYEPDYVIHPSDARRFLHESGKELISPCLTAIAGEKVQGSPGEWFNRFMTTLPRKFDNFKPGGSRELNSVGDVKRFEYTYGFSRVGEEWKSIGLAAVRPGGVFGHVDGSCLASDWHRWEPVFRKYVTSLTIL